MPTEAAVTRRRRVGSKGAEQTLPLPTAAVVFLRRGEMSVRIKAVVDRFVRELKEALDADIQDRIMKEREMQSYIAEREVAEREAAWKVELSRRELTSLNPVLAQSRFSFFSRMEEPTVDTFFNSRLKCH
jgi:hypothetical protein